MAFKLCALRSGSRGNATLIMTDKTAMLVDCGISLSSLKSELGAFNLTPSDLDCVLITHEHNDHVSGLNKIAVSAPLICHDLTYAEIRNKIEYEPKRIEIKNFDLGFEVGDVTVQPFRIPHDAAYPVGYSFYNGGEKIAIATDIGHINDGIVNNLKGCNLLLLESNYDEKMLLNGTYPYYLKKRILGNRGHLSNADSSLLLKRVFSDRLEILLLGHISKENNTPEFVLDSANKTLKELNSSVSAYALSQTEKSLLFEVK